MNKDLLKNRKFQIGAVVVVLVLLVGFMLFKKAVTNSGQAVNNNILPTEAPVATIEASDLGLTLIESTDMRKATMEITKTDDITAVDYQLSYNAQVSGQQIPRGTIGHVDVKTPGQTISQEMLFGTCSDVCHYDTGITDVQLIVKVTKTDGKVYQAQTGVTSK